MGMKPIPHITEEYYCEYCEKNRDREDVRENWKCPNCNNYIQIRIITENLDNSCFRIPVNELSIGDRILLNRTDEFREILNLQDTYKNKNDTRIALKEYGVITLSKNTKILKLYGGWFN